MTLALLHNWVGYAIVGSWAIVAGWGFALRLLRYEETPTFWRFVALAQILLLGQLLVGLVLLLIGRIPVGGSWGAAWFDNVFHILYGLVFPIVTLVFAHRWSLEGRRSPHTIFAVAGLVLFGLTARAWMTGAGMG
ncbi:hypothetical protein ER308_00455 [Egibacter rhizosphaerae]|uniref:Uncharacterized protein n=1 Tax=Egibacter rhizosphaerae TaxID=1670831 RepID=A0A411YAI7_9ACTN|nr:hypothetical protein [Egibacter rhizosphaerae]QBI18192.1 hypothetical protein ER308_00455 [Egibacter rhizosphaerae]